ncbi:MAG: phosphatidylinositol dimannoside acyltransferase [Chloroflexota bacterium]|nr:phosphatidylinositol dimannoside acyltransferase [Chloroflexota bacterium]
MTAGRSSAAALLEPPPRSLRAGLWGASLGLRAIGTGRYALADLIGTCIYASSRVGRERCASNHQRLDPTLDRRAARRRALGSFRNYARTSVDFVWQYGLPAHQMHKHFRAYGLEHAHRAIEECGGGVFALAHFGSWDVAAGCGLASGLRITTVMAPVGPDLVTRIAAWARRRQDMEVLPSSNAARGLIRAVRRGRFAAILSDIPDRGETVLVDFCGGRVAFSTAASWLGRVAGVPVLPVECWRIGGLYRLVIHAPVLIDPGDTDMVVMQRVATGLEAAVRRAPEWWYPFGEVYRD